MPIAVACSSGDLTLEIETGSDVLQTMSTERECCLSQLDSLSFLRGLYETRFGHLDLRGWLVRIRATDDLRNTGLDVDYSVAGHTYSDAIDLAAHENTSLPHELNHVRRGSGHGGWCADFEPWSEQVLGIDQREYLGCR
ncbi:MAG TPA: hypothetical protein VFE93_16140 [Myxococcaceae bacterium]|jgi:hypothetical protein|nr:hypothetical protein [Myxococcaceae bacterium]